MVDEESNVDPDENVQESTDSGEDFSELYSMSDEEFMESGYERFNVENQEQEENDIEEVNGDESESSDSIGESDEQSYDELDTDEDGSDTGEDESDTQESDSDSDDDISDNADTDETGSDTDTTDDGSSDSDVSDVDKEKLYSSEFQKLLKPFIANGKEMQVNSADEALTLMKMGANYHKKMGIMAPNIKTIKVLEKNGIDNNTLNYLIDLKNNNPQAIQKLIKDSGVDPLDFDAEESNSTTYNPTEYNTQGITQEIAVEEVLDQIKETPTYERTISVVGNEWDQSSKELVGSNPEILSTINDHVASGIYDLISTEVNRQTALGQLKGLSNIHAYKTVGDQLEAKGAFNHLNTSNTDDKKKPVSKTITKSTKQDDTKLKEKRRAAGATKSSGSTTNRRSTGPNPLSMSDDEFMKQMGTG